MPVLTDVPAPWTQTLGPAQYDLIYYSLVVAGLALLAYFVRTWNSLGEVSPRYRTALYAGLAISAVATVAYAVLVIKFDTGYDATAQGYVPNAEAETSFIPRYFDWSVTVPLLMVEFLAVCSIAGARARTTRFVAIACAFLMIFTGFLGAVVVGQGESTAALGIWGAVSTVFFVILYAIIAGALRQSKGTTGEQAYKSLRNASILLLSVWGAYPIAYLIQMFLAGPEWTTTQHMIFSFADIAAKIGFGALIHKVAKLRTAEDVAQGEDTHPEPIWISSVKHSEAVQPAVRSMVEEPAFLHHAGTGHSTSQPVRTAPASVRATTVTTQAAPRGRSSRKR